MPLMLITWSSALPPWIAMRCMICAVSPPESCCRLVPYACAPLMPGTSRPSALIDLPEGMVSISSRSMTAR